MARNRFMVGLIFLVFFVISLLSNILGPIVPDIIRTFSVNLGAAGLLVFAFFIAYGVMSIPAGFLVERYSEKFVMICAFVGATLGSISFALHPTYKMAFLSLFVIGVGMAMLQVAINPLLRVSGGEEHFALNETIAQLIFGSASFLSPWIYSYLVLNLPEGTQRTNPLLAILRHVTPAHLPWVSLYWIFAAIAAVMVVVLSLSRFPAVQHTTEERPGTLDMYKDLIRRRLVWLYFLAIFSYVGCEQGTANWISQFLSHYHGYDPHTTGARAVSWFWGLMTAGCFAGALLLRIFDSRRVLIGAATGALLILATGIMGGAIVTVVIGRIGDYLGLRLGMALLYLTFGYIWSVGFWSKPLINNATRANSPG
jgi:FHS family L-fucose permease-like MFS transporter